MNRGDPRLGRCLCGEPATIRDTKADDGRLHFMCHDLTDEGKAKHYGFVDRSEAERVEEEFDDYVDDDDDDIARWGDDDDGESQGPRRRLPAEEFGGIVGLADAEDCTCEECKEAGKGAFYHSS